MGLKTIDGWLTSEALRPHPDTCYRSLKTEGGAIDFQNMQQIEKLQKTLGVSECRRLGLVFDDERGVATLTTAGLGYLIWVVAADVTSIAEAFAAGYQCAAEFHDPGQQE